MSEYKYVPVEPTEGMLAAACDAEHLPIPMWERMKKVYTDMLAVSPEQPSPAESDKEAVRNAALEEAANSCTNTKLMNIDSYCGGTASMCADRIRALKSRPAQPSDSNMVEKHQIKNQPSDSRTEFSDTEMLDWLLSDGDTICEMTDGSFEYYCYVHGRHSGNTPRGAIKAAMRAEEETK